VTVLYPPTVAVAVLYFSAANCSGDCTCISVPPTVAVIAEAAVLNLTVGQKLEVHCEAEGFPPPHVSWVKQVKILQ